MGKRRHPSACKSSPMKYLASEETDLSDGVQHGTFRDIDSGKLNFGNIGGTLAKGAIGGLIGNKAGGAAGAKGGGKLAMALGGPVGMVAGAAMGMAKDIRQARHGKWYNEGYEESDVGAMADLSDMGFHQ